MKIPILLLVLLLAVSACTQEEIKESKESSKDSTETQPKSNKEYVSGDIYDIYLEIKDAGSELRQQEKFKEYEGKYYKGIVTVGRIGKETRGRIPVTVLDACSPPCGTPATIYFDSAEYKAQLLEVEEYDDVEFEGKFTDFSRFGGITFTETKFIKVLK
jgi:hypothetical protein